MDKERTTKHTALIEREDDLLSQIDTCQQVLATMWRFPQTSDEQVHLPTIRRLMLALRAIERDIDDELLNVRLELSLLLNIKSAP